VVFDLVQRWLRASGLQVCYVRNITDIDDKIIKRAREKNESIGELTARFIRFMDEDAAALGVEKPDHEPRATEHVPQMLALIGQLEKNGLAYQAAAGDVNFSVRKFPGYGKLSGKSLDDLQAGERVDVDAGKEDPLDFVLWKQAKEGEPFWASPWGNGRPGWHIECSAMSMKYLGEQFDIHCGGIDHVPVHHTNEIAQSETATGKKPWVNFWMHGEFLNIADAKMAKSGENFITLQTLKDRGISPLAYRYFLLQAHYRKQLIFSWEALEAAESGLANLRKQAAQTTGSEDQSTDTLNKFVSAINDDLNMAEALAILWKALKDKTIDHTTVMQMDKVLGLDLGHNYEQTILVPEHIQTLLEARANARRQKNWAESDRIRDEILAAGYTVEDTTDGQQLKKT
jgi:cysteinyl-tRNA synthetase